MDCRGLGCVSSCRDRLASFFSARPTGVGDALFDWLSGMGPWMQAAEVKA